MAKKVKTKLSRGYFEKVVISKEEGKFLKKFRWGND